MKFSYYLIRIYYCLLFFFTVANSLLAQSTPEKRINKLDSLLNKSLEVQDSINREILFYKVKEDYYANSLDRQATHYEWLLSVLVALTTLISIGYFEVRFKSLRETLLSKIVEQQENFIDFEIRASKIEYDLHTNLSFSLLSLAGMLDAFREGFGKEEPETSSTTLKISALINHLKAYGKSKEAKDIEENEKSIHDNASKIVSEINSFYKGDQLIIDISSSLDFIGDLTEEKVIINEKIRSIKNDKLNENLMELIVKINQLKAVTEIAQTKLGS